VTHVKLHSIDQSIRLAGGRLGFLLIHGLGGTPMELRYVAQGLARAGHTVHVPQLAGHCGTALDLRATCWADWYASVEAEHDRLKGRCDAVVVGGLSMGAVMAIHHAARRPDAVSALALYAPSRWLDGWGVPWYASLFNLVTMKWFANWFAFSERDPWGMKDPRLRALIEQAIKSGDSSRAGIAALPGSLVLELRWLVQQVKDEIEEVHQPTLIIHPREDDRASLRNPHYLQRTLRCLTETVVLNDSYHLITLDRQRQVVVARTLEFASRVQRGAFQRRDADLATGLEEAMPNYSPTPDLGRSGLRDHHSASGPSRPPAAITRNAASQPEEEAMPPPASIATPTAQPPAADNPNPTVECTAMVAPR
jgi:carboxylesterase